MWHQSHKWIIEPKLAYEIRREMRVRESRHTAMLFDRKYYDIDTGKFNHDKLGTINSYALHEVIDDSVHNRMKYDISGYYYASAYKDNYEAEQPKCLPKIPKFVPKDDDFDKEEEIKPVVTKQLEINPVEKIVLNPLPHVDYDSQVREAQRRIDSGESGVRYIHKESVINTCNVRPNKWSNWAYTNLIKKEG